jgi:hypothetical protein
MRLVHAPVAAAPWSFWPLMALPKRLGKIVVENGYSLAIAIIIIIIIIIIITLMLAAA